MKNEESVSLYYSDYLELEKILASQHPKSAGLPHGAGDEMLFIVIHQAYELWFKQILYELDLVRQVFAQDSINDNSGDLSNAVHKLKRIAKILELLNHQVEVLDTMTPLDFLEFRNFLLPSSGFQSTQFRLIEAKLGLKMEQRYKSDYYKHTRPGGFSQTDFERINQAEFESTLKDLVVKWAERTPFFDTTLWSGYQSLYSPRDNEVHKFWFDYRKIYEESLSAREKGRLDELDKVFFQEGRGEFPVAAMRAVLFIQLYRNLPIFQLPFELLSVLISIDELLSNWRYKHLLMVRRMIGMRVGTGGTSGSGYLEGALSQHYIFKELTETSTFLVERSRLPQLPRAVTEKMSFNISS
jgi:tryptophan 2,3-dioxygenase